MFADEVRNLSKDHHLILSSMTFIQAIDNNRANRYFGPSLLDRTHQISFGGYTDLRGGFRRRFLRLSVFDKLQSLHQAHAADFAD